jgi:hypothetical protein
MPNMPAPCTNCLRFHYGICWEAPKQCFQCGGFNHIERYCPRQRRVQVDSGGLLPGTSAWCNKNGLTNDPELKQRVLNAIKTSPGCAIWLDGVCIYGGNQRHFSSDYMPKRRPFDDRTTRYRSRSPPRDRFQERSPLSRNRGSSLKKDPFGYDITPQRGQDNQFRRFRSRSPLRRERSSISRLPSPKQRSPTYSMTGNTAASRAKDNSHGQKSSGVSVSMPGLPSFSFAPQSCVPLRNVTNTQNAVKNADADEVKECSAPSSMKDSGFYKPSLINIERSLSQGLHVDDPYFILGIIEGAGEQE